MSTFFYRELTWAWIIIVGGLMITPGGVSCTVCGGPIITQLLGAISIVIGIGGFVLGRREAVRSR